MLDCAGGSTSRGVPFCHRCQPELIVLAPASLAHYRSLGEWAAGRARKQRCPVIGINGAQGSGKSTLARFLEAELRDSHGLRSSVVSLDDFYLPRETRRRLAASEHPLFITRGVPGTHDVTMGIDTLQRVRAMRPGEAVTWPRFSKADDDRSPPCQWEPLRDPVDLILFEGWCVGTPPQPDDELESALNDLERTRDADERWRRLVNQHLRSSYADWFSMLDALVFLQVPNMECVHRWRAQQELETARAAGDDARALQSPQQLRLFIQHYERLTAHALRVHTERADVVMTLNREHEVSTLRVR